MPGNTKALKVLIVDDDAQVASNIQDIFAELGGYDADVALSPFEGLGKLKNQCFDMVFTDILMPGMSGLELLKSIKSIDTSVPVVMITGFPTVEVAIQAMKEGASDFITKPFRHSQLKIIVDRLARERRLLLDNEKFQDELQNNKTIEWLNVRLHAKIKEVSTLYSVSEMFSAAPIDEDLAKVYQNIVDVALEITGYSFSMLMIVDGHNRQLVPAAVSGLAGYGISETVPIGSMHMADELLKIKEPLVMSFPEHLYAERLGISGGDFFCPACMFLPLLIKDELFGLLILGARDTTRVLSGCDTMLLRNLLRKACLTIENRLLYDSIFDTMRDTLHALVTAIEARDQYTLKHSLRVTDYSIEIAKRMGCTQEEIDIVRSAGHLHDIGKIGISDAILLKSGVLSPSEKTIIHQHPVIGENILRPLGFLPLERAIIRYHHERWDGRGYPDGLQGEGIPLLSRIIAVADSYDAMTTDRPYRHALTTAEALKELRRCHHQFDTRVVEAFLDCMRH